ncbi:hypothetical protein Vdis_1037 [Vulcanisaeta distributa DSM 14429]|uniref:Uncharacterized protein n=2 Tax=Vulcanisaeta distributa TaxID=164451 RepID=E1QQ54_VULDI|nr:hypothetical protein Vdis_1037 [Vulcanisaeta distributa DSM 14429]
MGMGSGSRLLFIAAVIIAAVIATSVLVALPTPLTDHGAVVRPNDAVNNKFADTNQGIVSFPTSLNTPIYVVGPQTLAQKLINIGINQSLIKPVGLDQLVSLPNNSVVVIDWSLIKPSIISSGPLGRITVNLTSPVIHDLAIAIARNDIIGIYANGSDEGIIEFVLAYSWAVATNHRLIFINGEPSNDYLLAYPIIPVNRHEPVVIVVRWVKPWGLIIGPVYLSQLTTVMVNMMRPTTTATTVSSNVDPVQGEDPCYEGYSVEFSSASSPSSGVYVTDTTTFIWAAPMLYSGWYQYGIPGYSDGNGTYYWDTCLLASNEIFGGAPSSVPINVIGYEAYLESPTMYNNGGLEGYQVGAIDYYTGYQMYKEGEVSTFVGDGGPTQWIPQSIGSTSIPFIGIGISLPAGTSEMISLSQNPGYSTSLPNVPTIILSNITWTFSIGASGSYATFPNAFEDISPASIYLPSLSTESYAAFPVDFENNAVTSWVYCAYYTYQTIWVNAWWVIDVVPSSSSTVDLSITAAYWNLANAPPGSYVSGVSSGIVYTPCTYS